jgi:hypothetical protein
MTLRSAVIPLVAFALAGCASMTDTQKRIAWTVVGGIVVTSAVIAIEDDDGRGPPCTHFEFNTDVGEWTCLSHTPIWAP